MPKPADLLQGTLDLLILKTLVREPLHGWGISKKIQELSDDALSVQQGSPYPAPTGSSTRADFRRVKDTISAGRRSFTGSRATALRSSEPKRGSACRPASACC
jgi:hypothetical protein